MNASRAWFSHTTSGAKCKSEKAGEKWSTVIWRLHADEVRESRTVALAQNRVEQEIEIAYHAGLVV